MQDKIVYGLKIMSIFTKDWNLFNRELGLPAAVIGVMFHNSYTSSRSSTY